jgi:hypothetical protein
MLKFFERLPLAIVIGILVLGLVLGVPMMTSPSFRLRIAALDAPPLAGMRANWFYPGQSLSSLMDGSFQKSSEFLLEDLFPFRAAIVRTTNQVYYSLFARSYMYRNEVVIGRRQYLYETVYLQHYCNTQREKHTQEEFDRWAKTIESLGDFFTKRGQSFLFVLTPSKAAYYPEYLPQWAGCSGQPPRPEYFLATAALPRTHVPYVDLSKLVLDAKGKYPLQLFNRGGTHWNMLGVALSAQEMAAKISAQGMVKLPQVRFSYVVDNHPNGIDTDLLDVLNLWTPNRNYPTARVSFERAPEGLRHAPRIAIVGGSFMGQMSQALHDTNMFESVDYYFYLMMEHVSFPPLPHPQPSPYTAEYYRELLAADIVILEENEGNLQSPHLRVLEEALARYAGRAAPDGPSKFFTQDKLRPCTTGTRSGC